MKRTEFIRSTVITGGAITAGILNPFTALAKISKPPYINLPRLVQQCLPVISILSTRSASNCYCNGTSCSCNNADINNYYNQSYIWDLISYSRFLYWQYLNDPYYNSNYLQNASVPFFNSYNSPIMRVEGPSLFGLCNSLSEYDQYSTKSIPAKDVFAPTYEISNAGYRFDVDACHETSYNTQKGTVNIEYKKPQSKVRVVAENKPKGILYHDNTYTI
jgi:hypothetical protein